MMRRFYSLYSKQGLFRTLLAEQPLNGVFC